MGSRPIAREMQPHISREMVKNNKKQNLSIFTFNKLLHYLCNVHSKSTGQMPEEKLKRTVSSKAKEQKRDLRAKKYEKERLESEEEMINNIAHESILNRVLAPILTQNSETFILGVVSSHPNDYQATLRTVQMLSRYFQETPS